MNGVYFLADDAVLQWALAMLVSLRSHEPTLPVVWVPFGGPDRHLRQHLNSYDVVTWRGEQDLREWEALGRTFFPTNPIGARLFRKLAVFDGPLETFIFLDTDVVIRRPLSWAYEALSRADTPLAFYDEALDDVYADTGLRRLSRSPWNFGGGPVVMVTR